MMTLPGFSADAALYWSSDRYRSNSTRNFGNAMEGNRIYMQKPESLSENIMRGCIAFAA